MSSSLATRPPAAGGILVSSKLREHHLERMAIVYVRQSSPHQVQENRESTALQYALADRAVQLGWAGAQIEVIDEDQAHSGTTAVDRLGFQRLLAEVSLDHVGIILGIEMSRLARSNKDWHQLLELCGIFQTLLADPDGLYDPTDYNDRLLLGLKGTMSEAELHILQGRMHKALLNKAKRGDLYVQPPVGYIKHANGGFAIDPDEQAQGVIRLIFDEFDRLGSARRVMRYLHEHDIKLPIRPHTGPGKGALEWRRATRDAVRSVLMHPLYAGTYRYGRRQTDPRRKRAGHPGSGRLVVTPDRYHALIPDRCPAYITQERYDRNQQRIRDNRVRLEAKGPPRDGLALLGGVMYCGRCGRRLSVHYAGRDQQLRYVCAASKDDCEIPMCPSLSGRVVDELVAEKILQALEPAALELSLCAADDLHQERQRLEQHWRQRLERGRYQTDRAQRQYQLIEPENRLVARELGRQWEAALREQADLEQQYARFRQAHPATLTDAERELILSLSRNLPAVWHAAATPPSDRQRIVRLLIDRVVVTIHGTSDRVDVAITWSGGFISQHELIRPVLQYRQLADYESLAQRIEELRGQGLSFARIAEQLNQEGFRPPKQLKTFHGDVVGCLFRKLCQARPSARRVLQQSQLREHEWFAVDLAAKLQMPKNTFLEWVRRGWVHLVRQLPGYRGRMICWADGEDVERLQQLRASDHHWWDGPLPAELITPKFPPRENGERTSPQ